MIRTLGHLFQSPSGELRLETSGERNGLEHSDPPSTTTMELGRLRRKRLAFYPLLVTNLIIRALKVRPTILPENLYQTIRTSVRQYFKRTWSTISFFVTKI